MNAVTFSNVRKSQDGRRIDLTIHIDNWDFALYFQSDGAELGIYPEALIIAVLLPAMKTGVPIIQMDAEVSPEFIRSIANVQQLFRSWKPTYNLVEIQSSSRSPFLRGAAAKTGLFYSGGIDSYYSFLTRRDELDALIYLDGFDVPLRYVDLRSRLRKNIDKISQVFDFPVITVETNLRDFHEHFLSWSFSHGSALACVGYLLADRFSKLWIAPGGNPYDRSPFGSHPDLDPLWSSDILRIETDPHDYAKMDKLKLLSQYEPVRETLRVCYQFPEIGLNCGVCAKCLRTMVYLQAINAYEEFRPLFQRPLDPRFITKFHSTVDENTDMLNKALKILEENGTYPETAKALRKRLYPNPLVMRVKKKLRKLAKPFFIRRK